MKPSIISQESIKGKLIPMLQSDGILYQKTAKVWARKAAPGELVTSVTSDGQETTNIAERGDFVLKNATRAGEMYIVKGDTFHSRYVFEIEGPEDYAQYHPIGKVWGVEATRELLDYFNLAHQFQFMAAWGDPIVVKKGDYLVSPEDFSEIYRVARQEFTETYQRAGSLN